MSAPLLVCHPQEDVLANLSLLTLASPRPSVPHTSAWSAGDYFSHTLQHPQFSPPPLQPLLFFHCSSCAVSSLNPLTGLFAEPGTGPLRAAGDNLISCLKDLGQTPDSNITPTLRAAQILSPQSSPLFPLFSKCLENPPTARCFPSF